MRENLIIGFVGASADEGNRYAEDLKSALLDISADIQVGRRREHSDSQDFGATLTLILGTTAVNALAQGIATWLRRNAGARLNVTKSDGTLIAEGLDSKDVARIVEAFSKVD